MTTTTTLPETDERLEALASTVRLKKNVLRDYKRGYLTGAVSYDDLAQAGRELSEALFEYSKAKFPNVKPKRLPYQALIR